jgi:uncharacterized coiled-coil protein SlyX
MTIAELSREQVQDLIKHLQQYLDSWGKMDGLETLLSRTRVSLDAYLDGGETPGDDDPVLTALRSALADRQRTLDANAAQLQQVTEHVDTVLDRLLRPSVVPAPPDDDDARSTVADMVDTVMDGRPPGEATGAVEAEAPRPAAPSSEAPAGTVEAVVEPERQPPPPPDDEEMGIWDALIESEADPQTGLG